MPQIWHIGRRAFVIGARFVRRTKLVSVLGALCVNLWKTPAKQQTSAFNKKIQFVPIANLKRRPAFARSLSRARYLRCTNQGSAKVLLAHMDEARLSALLKKVQFEQFSDHSITATNALKTHLSDIRTRGYSVDN